MNFGGAGAVIGHELTHGFDDQGRQFDARGNLKDWWTPADAKAFEDRAQCFVDQYSGFTAVDDVKLNGKLTLGENIADNGGLRIALMAYLARTRGPAARRRSTASRPSSACSSAGARSGARTSRPERARMLAQTNPHSPGHDRVNGVVSNMPEFQKAFSCKADAPMVRQNAVPRLVSEGSWSSRTAGRAPTSDDDARGRMASRHEPQPCLGDGSRGHHLLRALPAAAHLLRRDRADQEEARTATRSTGASRCPASAIRARACC